MKTETQVTRTIYDNENNIVEMNVTKVVTKTGSGAHVTLPKQLIGKKVNVIYNASTKTNEQKEVSPNGN